VQINVITKIVYVDHNSSIISAKALKYKLDKCGFATSIKVDGGSSKKANILQQSVGTPELSSSQFVETTILIENWSIENETNTLRKIMSSKYSKNEVKRTIFNFPSRTVKIYHDPKICSVQVLSQTINTNGFHAKIILDGASEGQNVALGDGKIDSDDDKEGTGFFGKINPLVFVSGICWIVSMLSFIGGNW